MTAKRTPKRRKAPNKGGRPRDVTGEVLEQAQALMGAPRHLSVVDAARELGVGKSQLYAALAAAKGSASPAPTPPAEGPQDEAPPDDADGDLELTEQGTDEDTLRVARRLLRKVELRIKSADPVRFASLVEKASSLIGRVEQIEKNRPRPPARDEVQEAIRGKMDEAAAFLLRHTREAAAEFAKARAALDVWAARELSPSQREGLARHLAEMLPEAA